MPETSPKNYILRYRGAGKIPETERLRVSEMPGVRILDDSPRMLLIESAQPIEPLRIELPEWSVSEEQTVPLPQPPRPKILQGSDT